MSLHADTARGIVQPMDIKTKRQLTDRRATTAQQIDFYLGQARMARLGLTTRRTEAFFLRQVEYFRLQLQD